MDQTGTPPTTAEFATGYGSVRGAGGSSSRGSGSGSMARSDPTHQNSGSSQSVGNQHATSSSGNMECESSSRTTLSQSAYWSDGDASNNFTSHLGAQGGHANSHSHTHLPSNHPRKPHPHSSNSVTLLQNHPPRIQAPGPLSAGTNIQNVRVVLPQVQQRLPNANVQGFVYTNAQLDGVNTTGSSSSSSIRTAGGGIIAPISGFALTGHPNSFKSTQGTVTTGNHPQGIANSGQNMLQYSYTIAAQSTANQGQSSSQSTKSGDESPMVGMCVQSSVASH